MTNHIDVTLVSSENTEFDHCSAYMFPRGFGDEFGDEFGDSLNLVINLVTNSVMNFVNH